MASNLVQIYTRDAFGGHVRLREDRLDRLMCDLRDFRSNLHAKRSPNMWLDLMRAPTNRDALYEMEMDLYGQLGYAVRLNACVIQRDFGYKSVVRLGAETHPDIANRISTSRHNPDLLKVTRKWQIDIISVNKRSFLIRDGGLLEYHASPEP